MSCSAISARSLRCCWGTANRFLRLSDHPADVDHRADIYALGVVFYQMLTGELPGKRLEAPSKKVHIDVRLDEIVLRAMEKDPELRYQKASMMKTRVDDLGAVEMVQPTVKTRRTGRIVAICCGVLGVILSVPLVVVGIFFLLKPTPKQDVVAVKSVAETLSVAEKTEIGGPEVGVLAEIWIAGIDAGKYAQSWKDAAKFFQTAITESGWISALEAVRKPLGAVKSRKIRDLKKANALPGAPDGEYVVIQFDTSFGAKEKAVETVTFMLEKDGSWRATGYFIR